jgi:hypothetical protein
MVFQPISPSPLMGEGRDGGGKRQMPVGEIDTEGAIVGALCDGATSWPCGEEGSYILEGFQYGRIQVGARSDWGSRKAWLDGQKFVGSLFAPQPYEHLVSVLRKTGHPRDAREIAVAKHEALRNSGVLSWRGWLWNHVMGGLIGHGYKPWLALYWMAAVVLLGSVVFYNANSLQVMQPAKERILMEREKPGKSAWVPKDYPEFNPIIYSLDVFLPIVDLHQESYWLPATDLGHWYAGGWYRAYMWLHIALGWIMTTIAVAGLTGIVKKD